MFQEIMNKNDLCEIFFKISAGQCAKTFLEFTIFWLVIFEINSRIIASQIIGKISSSYWLALISDHSQTNQVDLGPVAKFNIFK
jgi:hypothetical protein